ncbi:MAG: TIR domain-containing protein [Anaerolinea sp.]|nr:TIR domain-containing protein [Anaerolinea sp.]
MFISYSRANTDFARKLYKELEGENLTLWRDRSEMEGGANWWEQIKEAIRGSENLILVLSKHSMTSDNVANEWRYARSVGTRVVPIIAEWFDLLKAPRWMTKLDLIDLRPDATEHDETWKRLIKQLNSPIKSRPIPFTAPELPAHFVQRPTEFEKLVGLLLDEQRGEPVAITTALQGAGGFGKTTLAIALCHDTRIREAFDDGCLFIEVTDQPNVLKLLLDQIELLSGERPGFSDPNQASARFRELLDDRDMLIVLDNVWDSDDARHFIQRSEKTRAAFVITTREQEIAAAMRARMVKVDELTQAQTLAVLGSGLTVTDADREALLPLAEQIKGWALLAEILGAELQNQVEYEEARIKDAVADIRGRLSKKGFDHYQRSDITGRNRAISASLEVSLQRLTVDQRRRFYELAIFSPAVTLRHETVAQLWAATGGLDEGDTNDLLRRLGRMSLLTRFAPAGGEVHLHDVIRDYIGKHLADAAEVHAALLRAWGGAHDLPDEYAWKQYSYHLLGAGQSDELADLLFDVRWLKSKLEQTDANALLEDFKRLFDAVNKSGAEVEKQFNLHRINDALRLSAHVLFEDVHQFPSQLTGRLLQYADRPGISAFLDDLKPQHGWLEPLRGTLMPPGAGLVRTMYGHEDEVWAICISADGTRAVTCGKDKTVRVWDLETGLVVHTLRQHTEVVMTVRMTADGKLAASCGDDHTVVLWNTETGEALRTFTDHTGNVLYVSFSWDNKLLASCSMDKTVKIWEIASGELVHDFKVELDPRLLEADGTPRAGLLLNELNREMWHVEFTPDSRYILAILTDGRILQWELARNELVATYRLPKGMGISIEAHPDNEHFLATSEFGEIRRWRLSKGGSGGDVADAGELFGTHKTPIWGLGISGDGKRAVTVSSDHIIKLWDTAARRALFEIDGHSGGVYDASISHTGHVFATVSDDETVKLWSVDPVHKFIDYKPERHGATAVRAVALLPDGETAISAAGSSLKLWKLTPFSGQRVIENAHGGTIWSIKLTGDGQRAITASADGTVKLWNTADWSVVQTFSGHTCAVRAADLNHDGTLAVSASTDGTVRVWDVASGQALRVLIPNDADLDSAPSLKAVVLSRDGHYIIAGSTDGNAYVWDAASGAALRTLRGHEDWVTGVAVCPHNVHVATSSRDNTVRVWSFVTGDLLHTFDQHEDNVTAVSIDESGTYAISVSTDFGARAWDMRDGVCVATFSSEGYLLSAAMRSVGEPILIGGNSGMVHVLRLHRG